VAVDGVAPWRPDRTPVDPVGVRSGARVLHASLGALGPARGLGRLLVTPADDALAARARPRLAALARACRLGHARGVVEAARPLLGLGDGLTPSGDDCVGGALFACHALAGGSASTDPAIAALLAEARARTHPISAQLLADLAAGEGWAPLHALLAALAGDPATTTVAARAVVALGHSSGWDLLAGFLAALLGPEALATRPPAGLQTRPV
jgi:hypothetical protein